MPGMPADAVCPVIPALRYRDASDAITWLCEAFGFREHLVVRGDDGPPGSMSVYVVVADADAHEATAAAAGAEIVMPSEDQAYGGRLYTCRDPEGHVWSFGTYDPWGG